MKPRVQTAFTLVELLVAMIVLVVLIVMIAQLVNNAANVTTVGRKELDADSQARMVFQRMALDFQTMIRRKDVDYIFSKQGAKSGVSGSNDKMFFYSEAPAYAPSSMANKSSVSLIGYRINASYQLERLGKALAWDGSGNNPGSMVFLAFASGNTSPLSKSTLSGNWSATIGGAPAYSGTDNDYHVIAETVYRLEFCFQVKDLTNPIAPGAAYSNYPIARFGLGSSNQSSASTTPAGLKVGDRWYDTVNNRAFYCSNMMNNAPSWQPLGMDDVLSVVVAIGILDNSSRQMVKDPTTGAIRASTGNKMVSVFSDCRDSDLQPASLSIPPKLMAESWLATLNTTGFAKTTGILQGAASQIRIYQRGFRLKAN